MHPEETPETPPTEGQTVPPEEQTVPSERQVQEDEQVQDVPPIQQAQSLAREKPVPIALAGAFIAGVVVGRIASRR
jgi:hypothetical protein